MDEVSLQFGGTEVHAVLQKIAALRVSDFGRQWKQEREMC
jgi:hypothetical protein